MPTDPKPIFISYAHEDNESSDASRRWLDRLKQFLHPLVQQDELTICSDQDIDLGEDWHAHIQKHLNGARAAVLLISPAFLASKYVQSSELPVLLRNAKEKGVKIIPVIVRRSLFEETKFRYPDPKTGPEEFTLASLQASNSPTKPLNGMTEDEQDEVLLKVARALLKLAAANPGEARQVSPALPVSRESISPPRPPTPTISILRPRIYISYSTHTKGAGMRIFRLAESLRSAGIDARIDRYYSESLHGMMPPAPRAGQNAWDLWQEEEIKKADRVLIVCDQKYAQSPASSGVALDLKLMQADLVSGAQELGKFIPVGFGSYSSNSTFVPAFIRGANYYDLTQKGGVQALIRRFRTEFPSAHIPEKAQTPVSTRPSGNPPGFTTAGNSNPSIVWLHLSDLHNCKAKTGWDAHRVLRPLIQDLKRMEEDHGLVPQILFFTGDAAFGNIGNVPGSTLKEQFDGAQELIEAARGAFSTPVPRENVFIVPGNHDVDRREVATDQSNWLGDRRTQAADVDALIQKGDRQWQRYMERLAAYGQFLTRHGYSHLLSDPTRLIFGQVRELHGIKMGIAGFNSAWSCSGDDDRGRLWFGGNWQAGEVLGKLREADFCVSLIHHPFGWFVEAEDTRLRIQFEREFAFHLHGHEHLGWVDAKADGHVRVAAGACYDKSDLENGYNFVRLDLITGEGEIWLRKYDAQGGGWVPRVVADRTTNDGLWRIGRLPWLQPLLAKADH